MLIFYGKGKVGNAFLSLCDFLQINCVLMDDSDRNDDLLAKSTTIVPTPGIPQLHDVYTLFGNKIVSEMDFLWNIIQEQKIDVYTIGITGTDGKSTVTRILAEALKTLLPKHTTHITGNFDDPMSKTILDILQSGKKENNIFVIECSSFMLYPTKQFHFNQSIRTNFATDHLNRHPNMDEYFLAKQKIITLADHAYTTQEIFEKLPEENQKKTTIYGTQYDLSKTHFVGKHNQKNMALVFQVIQSVYKEIMGDEGNDKGGIAGGIIGDIDRNTNTLNGNIHIALENIYPLEHRMQPVKTIGAITWYDDGKSTSAQSLGAALESFQEPIIAICGGSDKGDHFDHLKDAFTHTVHGVFLGQTAPEFARLFEDRGKPYTIVDSMEECVQEAWKQANNLHTKVILFSPGCASFGMFKDYKDRAKQFLDAVDKIEE